MKHIAWRPRWGSPDSCHCRDFHGTLADRSLGSVHRLFGARAGPTWRSGGVPLLDCRMTRGQGSPCPMACGRPTTFSANPLLASAVIKSQARAALSRRTASSQRSSASRAPSCSTPAEGSSLADSAPPPLLHDVPARTSAITTLTKRPGVRRVPLIAPPPSLCKDPPVSEGRPGGELVAHHSLKFDPVPPRATGISARMETESNGAAAADLEPGATTISVIGLWVAKTVRGDRVVGLAGIYHPHALRATAPGVAVLVDHPPAEHALAHARCEANPSASAMDPGRQSLVMLPNNPDYRKDASRVRSHCLRCPALRSLDQSRIDGCPVEQTELFSDAVFGGSVFKDLAMVVCAMGCRERSIDRGRTERTTHVHTGTAPPSAMISR